MNYVIYEWSAKTTDLDAVLNAVTFWVKTGNPEEYFGVLNTPSPRSGSEEGGQGATGNGPAGTGGR